MADHINPVTTVKDVAKKIDWKDIFKEIVKEVVIAGGMDLILYQSILPKVRKMLSSRTPGAAEYQELIDILDHIKKGEYSEGLKKLSRLPLGVGLGDEEILDEVFREAELRHGDDASVLRKIRGLYSWLALPANKRIRKRFRDAITIQPNRDAQVDLVIGYVNMSNAQRKTRMTATGKLDPSLKELTVKNAKKLVAQVRIVDRRLNRIGTRLQRRATGTGRRRWQRIADFLIK